MTTWRQILSWRVVKEFRIGARVNLVASWNPQRFPDGSAGTIIDGPHLETQGVAWQVKMDSGERSGMTGIDPYFYEYQMELL